MKSKRANPDFLNGVPELLLLRLISDRPRYGYDLVQSIREASGDALSFGEGCIYPILHRLEADGFLQARREVVAGRSRVVYRITAQGTKRLAGATATWKDIVRAVNRALEGAERGQIEMA